MKYIFMLWSLLLICDGSLGIRLLVRQSEDAFTDDEPSCDRCLVEFQDELSLLQLHGDEDVQDSDDNEGENDDGDSDQGEGESQDGNDEAAGGPMAPVDGSERTKVGPSVGGMQLSLPTEEEFLLMLKLIGQMPGSVVGGMILAEKGAALMTIILQSIMNNIIDLMLTVLDGADFSLWAFPGELAWYFPLNPMGVLIPIFDFCFNIIHFISRRWVWWGRWRWP
eukprot:gnl/TRDRNA2_/TRDRNA2_181414_c0_seq1.p1 gnl/TRDRNA2_/TRDRNA2_181414_c0~~gnl/TRDRNA2_/TRDRNA2_181414_c0_seq1.p1  ORF type:complete len:223 (-),score=30.14 gnl/TRDRNA2_/TRDRNA2_181414_c0_seq1:160-828(-)